MDVKGEFCTRESDKVNFEDVLCLVLIVSFIGFLLFIERFL